MKETGWTRDEIFKLAMEAWKAGHLSVTVRAARAKWPNLEKYQTLLKKSQKMYLARSSYTRESLFHLSIFFIFSPPIKGIEFVTWK
jgi:hypothetical protein